MKDLQSVILPERDENSYWAITSGALYSLILILPLLVAYEVNAIFFGVDIVARSTLQNVFYDFWPWAEHFSALLIIAVLLSWHIVDKKSTWRVRPGYMFAMACEAAMWSLPLLAIAMIANFIESSMTTQLAGSRCGLLACSGDLDYQAAAIVNGGLFQTVMTRVGGGIYEEFIFRLVAFNLLAMALIDMMNMKPRPAVGVIIAVTSLAFAWQHFPGMTIIQWPIFIFYAVCGVYLGMLYLMRGFGVAVCAHVCYNIIVTIAQHQSGQI